MRVGPEPSPWEGGAGAIPRSRLQAIAPPLQAPRRAGNTPLGGNPARGGSAPRPRGPSPSPAGCPHLAKQPSQTLAVELHLQPGSRVRFRDPSPWTVSRTGSWTAAAEDQTSQRYKAPPLPTRRAARVPRPTFRGGSAESDRRSCANSEQQKRVSAEGTTTQLAGKKLGDRCEEGNRKDLRRSGKGSSLSSGREFLEGGAKFSRVSKKIKIE